MSKEQERPFIDANALERIAKERPDEFILKGSGVLKLLQAVRYLEAEVRALAAPTPDSSGEGEAVDVNDVLEAVDALWDLTRQPATVGQRIDAKIALKKQILALATRPTPAPHPAAYYDFCTPGIAYSQPEPAKIVPNSEFAKDLTEDIETLCMHDGCGDHSENWSKLVRGAVDGYLAVERERCAKMCEPPNMDNPSDWTEYARTRAECAARIRGEFIVGDQVVDSTESTPEAPAVEPAKECRHCGWLCAPNDGQKRAWYPLEQSPTLASETARRQLSNLRREVAVAVDPEQGATEGRMRDLLGRCLPLLREAERAAQPPALASEPPAASEPARWYPPVSRIVPLYLAAPSQQPATGEIEAYKRALIYVAYGLHGARQHMLCKGITLSDGDRVMVNIGDIDVDTGRVEMEWPNKEPDPATAELADVRKKKAATGATPELQNLVMILDLHCFEVAGAPTIPATFATFFWEALEQARELLDENRVIDKSPVNINKDSQ